jgi:hypothetical protein
VSKRLTVVYEVPEDCDVTRITGTGELEVVSCVSGDALQRLAAAEADASHLRVQLLSANRTCEMFVDEFDRNDGTAITPNIELIDLARFHKGQLYKRKEVGNE